MNSNKNNMTTVIIVILLAAVAFFGYKYYQANLDPQAVAQAEVDKLVAEVGELMVLPADETPTVATVSDPEALQEQIFFAGAQEGDKVLIYTTARKAILYSVSLNKIIEVAPVNIGDQAEGLEASAPDLTPASVETDEQ